MRLMNLNHNLILLVSFFLFFFQFIYILKFALLSKQIPFKLSFKTIPLLNLQNFIKAR